MKNSIVFLFFISTCFVSLGQNFLIRIYNDKSISSAKIKCELGKYILIADNNDTLLNGEQLSKGDVIELKSLKEKVIVRHNSVWIGSFSQIKIQSLGFKNIFSITPNIGIKRTYDDNLQVIAKNNFLFLLNDVFIENYIAGVVQSEIYGKPEMIDIFKVQSVISRTYALKNKNKHITEGFNLCDDVHCQVYANRCIKPEILTGAISSKDEILVDSAGEMVEAAFHSNSGGQTANSEDVWIKPISYLQSVPDTFSLQMKNAIWEKIIKVDDWLSYFSKTHLINVNNDSIKNELLTFSQNERKCTICNIPLKLIRSDLKLRSTFFSVVLQNDNTVKLTGKGYGHGVGLSQEGAIRMVELGFNYEDILHFYYKGTKILKIKEEE